MNPLCKALLAQGRAAEVVVIARSMTTLLLSFPEHSIAAAAILHFYDLAKQGTLSHEVIEHTKRAIEASRRGDTPAQTTS